VPADSPARGDRVEVPDVISALAPFLAGLGLFFTGVHFIAANLLLLFVLVHVVQVILFGAFNLMRSMITGRYAIMPEKTS